MGLLRKTSTPSTSSTMESTVDIAREIALDVCSRRAGSMSSAQTVPIRSFIPHVNTTTPPPRSAIAEVGTRGIGDMVNYVNMARAVVQACERLATTNVSNADKKVLAMKIVRDTYAIANMPFDEELVSSSIDRIMSVAMGVYAFSGVAKEISEPWVKRIRELSCCGGDANGGDANDGDANDGDANDGDANDEMLTSPRSLVTSLDQSSYILMYSQLVTYYKNRSSSTYLDIIDIIVRVCEYMDTLHTFKSQEKHERAVELICASLTAAGMTPDVQMINDFIHVIIDVSRGVYALVNVVETRCCTSTKSSSSSSSDYGVGPTAATPTRE